MPDFRAYHMSANQAQDAKFWGMDFILESKAVGPLVHETLFLLRQRRVDPLAFGSKHVEVNSGSKLGGFAELTATRPKASSAQTLHQWALRELKTPLHSSRISGYQLHIV